MGGTASSSVWGRGRRGRRSGSSRRWSPCRRGRRPATRRRPRPPSAGRDEGRRGCARRAPASPPAGRPGSASQRSPGRCGSWATCRRSAPTPSLRQRLGSRQDGAQAAGGGPHQRLTGEPGGGRQRIAVQQGGRVRPGTPPSAPAIRCAEQRGGGEGLPEDGAHAGQVVLDLGRRAGRGAVEPGLGGPQGGRRCPAAARTACTCSASASPSAPAGTAPGTPASAAARRWLARVSAVAPESAAGSASTAARSASTARRRAAGTRPRRSSRRACDGPGLVGAGGLQGRPGGTRP